ncbi:MAG: B12-binding domain-containing radical SAM protein [Syntrophaceae bacterium]|nr:B12-binding domain-containing radical SAM protein [Syntrophaceae bacterium]
MRPVILLRPAEGLYSKVFRPWVPLSLLGAAAKLDEAGYPIILIDQRSSADWKDDLRNALMQNPICVGVTSMTGSQITCALDMSAFVKQQSFAPVVWGGVHATLFPLQTVENPLIDIVIKGEGEESFLELVLRMERGESLRGLEGVVYKDRGEIVNNPDRPFLDLDTLPPVPYHLIDVDKYLHRYFDEDRVLEFETSRGCPFNCTFCYNPLYSRRRWRALSASRVLDLLTPLVETYGVSAFHFVDDSFFIDQERTREIMKGVLKRQWLIKMGFQGSRIDTFDQMSDADLELIIEAGGAYLQVGVESGSPRILEILNKNIHPENVLAFNRRLARYPRLKVYYNFMCGFPTETREDVLQSTTLAWALLRDNPQALISAFHFYKPYPGTSLCEQIVHMDDVTPKTLEGWGNFNWTQYVGRDQDKETRKLMERIEIVSVLADRKMSYQSDSAVLRILAAMYRPLARFRLKHNWYSWMPEHWLRKWMGE